MLGRLGCGIDIDNGCTVLLYEEVTLYVGLLQLFHQVREIEEDVRSNIGCEEFRRSLG